MAFANITHLLPRPAALSLVGALAFIGLASGQAFADTLVVGGSGNYTTIQAAVLDAEDGDVISVNEGTYAGFDLRSSSDTNGLDITIEAAGDREDTIINTKCVLTGKENPAFRITGFTFEGDKNATPFPVLAGIVGIYDTATQSYAEGIIDDCAFVGCHYAWSGGAINGFAGAIASSDFDGCTSDMDGGAVAGAAGSTADGCTFTNCDADNGGAMRGVDTVRNCEFVDCDANVTYGDGGALLAIDDLIENCKFTNCTAVQDGGAIAMCDADITRCTFRINYAGRHGGAIALCDGKISNNLVYDNEAEEHGGGIHESDGDIVHNMIVANHAGKKGGGLRDSNGLLRNNVIWQNTATNGSAKLSRCSVPKYSCINGGFSGGTKIRTGNPNFTAYSGSSSTWDLTLGNGSSCLDKGKDGDSTTDFNGVTNSRPVDLNGIGDGDNNDADIGAYEAQTAP